MQDNHDDFKAMRSVFWKGIFCSRPGGTAAVTASAPSFCASPRSPSRCFHRYGAGEKTADYQGLRLPRWRA